MTCFLIYIACTDLIQILKMENRARQHVLGTSNTKLSLVDQTEGKDIAIVTASKVFKWYSSGSIKWNMSHV